MSNLTGSSMLEIAAFMTIVPILILLRHAVILKSKTDPLNMIKASSKKDDKAIIGYGNWTAYMIKLCTDFLFVVLPMLLFLTVLAEWTQVAAFCLVLLLVLCLAFKRFCSSPSHLKGAKEAAYSFRVVLSSYRVLVMIITCLCILAVDFRIFPRRYGKTETYGTGLMDLGVGSFVLANALVSRQARNVLLIKWKTAIQSISPLIILGFGRLISTTGVGYQVHVGEYGVHWNFFFTLAAVSILTSMIDINPQHCGVLGLLILIGYQICLLVGLNDYLLSNERMMSLISQNKEGIFSIFGYWGMYLIGAYLGNSFFFGGSSTSRIRSNQSTNIRIWTVSIMSWLLTIILDKYVERVSRRMCNLAYVTFVLAQNFQAIAILMLSDLIDEQKTSVLEQAFNCNLLGLFLLGNVFTGLINMSLDTISVSSFAALLILIGYAFVLCLVAGFAEYSGIKLKFW